MAWDLDLCTDHKEQVLVPFHYFVKPQSQPFPGTSNPPFRFLDLPIDIQLTVYEHCNGPTLFQLMRTCSRTRDHAAKLFWSNITTDHWYYSGGDLFEPESFRHPIMGHCPEFARRVTRIELDLIRIEFTFQQSDDLDLTCTAKSQFFWERVQKAFPAARKVVLQGVLPDMKHPLPPPDGEFNKAYNTIETAVQCAPLGIVVHIAFINEKRPPCYTLWQVTSTPKPKWQVLNEAWTPTRVLLPPRKFSGSPLGDLLTFIRRYSALDLETRGLHWLKIESYVRYAIDGVIHCPRLDCDKTFSDRSQWKQHLRDAWHDRILSRWEKGDPMMELWCFKHTPEAEKAAIEAREQRIDASYQQVKRIQRRVGFGWGGDGTEQRRLFEEQFRAQLREENFAAPGQLNEDGGYYCPWMDCLSVWFDPTHVYYAGE